MEWINSVSEGLHKTHDSTKNSAGEVLLRTRDALKETPDVIKKPFLYSTAIVPFVFTFLFTFVYLHEYLTLVWTLISSVIVAIPIGVFCVKFRSVFAVFVLSAPELFARVLRIYLIQIALLYSPMPQIQENMQIFIKAHTCTTDVALQAGRNASRHLMSKALGVTQDVLRSINDVSTDINNAMFVPFDGINTALEEIRKFFIKVGEVRQKCGNSMSTLSGSCSTIVSIPRNVCNKLNIFNIRDLCSNVRSLENNCDKVKNSNLCSVFSEVSKPQVQFDNLQGSLNRVKSEFSFGLKLNYDFDAGVSNDTIQSIRESIDDDISAKFDTFILIKRIFSILIAFSVLYILVSKARLVKKYNNKQAIKCGKISKLFLATNPLTIQLLILCLLAFLDFGIRYVYELQQMILQKNVIEIGTHFDASVSNTGGSIGIALASAITKTFQIFDSMKIGLDLSSCYEKRLEYPSIYSYFLVAAGLLCGIVTYVLDIFCRKRQVQLLQFANKWYDNLWGRQQ